MQRKLVAMRYLTAILLLAALACGSCSGQELDSGGTHETGTLNLLLANRRGFVIAADSRRTQQSDGRHWDDSQKLFRVGPRSALVIAGFASWAAHGSPLDVQVASLLREEFADHVWASGKRHVAEIPAMIRTKVGYELEVFGIMGATDRPAVAPEQLDFQVLAAGVVRGRVQIVRVNFRPRIEPLGPFDLAAPFYDMQSSSVIADHFVALSAGIDTVARAILDGTIDTRDERILNYYRSRSQQQLNNLSLGALRELAIAILDATKHVSVYVGGPNQIGVFPRKGQVRWELPELATDRTQFHSTILSVGVTYTPNGLSPLECSLAHGKKFVTELGVSLVQPFDEPFTQVFVGSWFRDVSVLLDGNAFSGDHFSNVTFEYKGGRLYFPPSNTIAGCVLQAPPDVTVPPLLAPCLRGTLSSASARGAIGAPIKAEPKGCVTGKKDGRMMVKTNGRQNGKDCKGSGIVVLFQPLGPGSAER